MDSSGYHGSLKSSFLVFGFRAVGSAVENARLRLFEPKPRYFLYECIPRAGAWRPGGSPDILSVNAIWEKAYIRLGLI